MKTSITSHYSDFQPSFKYKFFEVENAVHTSSQIPVTIWTFNISEFVQNNQDYAIDKIKNAVEKLWTNLNALKRISHPSLLRIYETTDEESEPGVISFSSEQIKYCLDGSFFKKSTNTSSRFSKDESLFIASQISDGLSYLHDQLNVASFGICPENIFITPNFDVKIGTLIHFAKFSEPLDVIEPNLYPTQCSIFDIDKRFLSPELKTHNNVTSKADVFMFGLTILYCYEGEDFLNEMTSSKTSEPAFLLDFLNGPKSTNTPEDMKLILSKCLSEDQSERPTFQQLSDTNALTQLLIKALNFLDTIETKPIASHKSFYKGLGGIINQFSERVLLLKIIPILVDDACTNSDDESLLIDHILPILLTASLKIPANQIDAKIVRRLFNNEACQNFFLENCRNFLSSENETNEINERIPLIGVVILNSYRDENTKERGVYLMQILFEQFANIDQDKFKETILKPLFKSSDCAILFLFYIQTIDEEKEDTNFKNLAVLIISYSIEISNDENYEDKSSRLDQKILELIPTFLKYGKELKLTTFESLVLDPVLSKPETSDILIDSLEIFDDPEYLIQIASSLKEKNNSSFRKVMPILIPKIENMNFNDFEEKVFKPFFFADPLCTYSMIENIDLIKKVESKSPQKDSDEAKLTIVQTIIINSYKHNEEIIREKVPATIPLLYSSISKHQKQNPAFVKESIFKPFYENFSSNPTPYQEQVILELIKHSSKSTPIVDIIVDLTFENCKSNQTIMNEVSSLIPSYIRNAKDIKLEVIQYLIDTNKYDSRISDIIVSKIAAINDVNTKLFILKYALDNPTESTHYATLAWIFLTAANSTEFSQKYSSSKFSEIQTEFVGPLFRVLDSADYLIQNFDSFDHQYPTSKKIQMLIVTEISNLANENPELSALADGIPILLQKCAIDTSESITSLKSISKSFSYKEPIDIAYISTVLDSLNKQTSEELAPECSKQLRSLYKKVIKVKNDETNKTMMINKIAIVLSNLPPYSRRTTNGISLAIELVENKLTESSKREHLLNFIDQTVAAIRAVKDYQPSDDESDDEDDNNSDDDDDDISKKQNQQQSPKSPQPEAKKENVFNPFESDNQSVQDPFSSNENNSSATFNDPFANTNESTDSITPSNDPFKTASNSNDPFKPTNSNANNSFNAASNNNDPFKPSSNVDDPFKASANNDPFKTTPSSNDPFNAASNSNDPFKTASNVSDPFKASSENNPFKTTPSSNDPFKTTPSSNDPFKATPNNESANSNHFKTAPVNNDPFNTASSSNDPFKTSSHQEASQDDPPSSQSSSTNNQPASNLSQFPSLQQTTGQGSTKSVKIDVKKDKKKEKELEKEKKKKEKLEKKQKAKDKKTKDKERRKSRNDIPVESGSSRSLAFQEPENKMRNDPNQALKSRSMSRPVINTGMTNPFSTPSNAVDPFKQMDSNQPNHFGQQNNATTAPVNNNPFSSSSTNNNPFSGASQPVKDPFGSSGLNNPFATTQKTSPPQQNANNNDPFAHPQQENDNQESDDDDDDDANHHHHHHHHGKSKNDDSSNGGMVPEKRGNRQPTKRNTELRQSIPPNLGANQNENVFKQSHQRTPSFDIFGRAQTAKQTSSFESEGKATSDAKIDFNNDEIDFDSE